MDDGRVGEAELGLGLLLRHLRVLCPGLSVPLLLVLLPCPLLLLLLLLLLPPVLNVLLPAILVAPRAVTAAAGRLLPLSRPLLLYIQKLGQLRNDKSFNASLKQRGSTCGTFKPLGGLGGIIL